MRRGVDMVYIVENNGVYGLTKGQFSATSDKGSKSRRGVDNPDAPIDLVALALQLGATFVARGFSGDKAQLVPLIKAAFEHRGAAFIDFISPCVAFNNHEGSTKSFDYVREHNVALNSLDFITRPRADHRRLRARRARGDRLHDGSSISLRKIAPEHDVHDRIAAINLLHQRAAAGEIVTGLSMSIGAGRSPRPSRDRRQAAQRARREGALPGLRGARALERGFALRGWAGRC